jgi:hypothetical protein
MLFTQHQVYSLTTYSAAASELINIYPCNCRLVVSRAQSVRYLLAAEYTFASQKYLDEHGANKVWNVYIFETDANCSRISLPIADSDFRRD